ncbi:hypothetical protein B0H13DRAFT_2656038 [Mycena leptocephala]|nr:hypothetical protein B0H13DRAFT_2656038 [Mycena leptocephala]
MFSFQLLSVLSSAVLLVSALPAPKAGSCPTSAAVLDLPAGQTQLVSPTTAPLFVSLGVGVQNYTCNASTLKYTSVGAVAAIFDISCLAPTPLFANLQTVAFSAWSAAPASLSATTIGTKIGAPALLGFHYFVPSPSGTGLSPMWDFTASGKSTVLAAKAGDITAPTASATNVDWLMLNSVQGSLATQVFRIDTVNGQPPTSCVAGSADISVKYTAKYLLY